MTGHITIELSPEIRRVADAIKNDDGKDHGTADPIFVVYTQRPICGVDPECHDDAELHWYHSQYGDYSRCEPKVANSLEREYQKTYKVPKNFIRSHVIRVPEYAGAFFTREGAERFINRKRHELCDPYIFVESAYWHTEMCAIRQLLTDIASAAANLRGGFDVDRFYQEEEVTQ